eukprot:g11869.t1 g11869   contig6:759074-759526(+)
MDTNNNDRRTRNSTTSTASGTMGTTTSSSSREHMPPPPPRISQEAAAVFGLSASPDRGMNGCGGGNDCTASNSHNVVQPRNLHTQQLQQQRQQQQRLQKHRDNPDTSFDSTLSMSSFATADTDAILAAWRKEGASQWRHCASCIFLCSSS